MVVAVVDVVGFVGGRVVDAVLGGEGMDWISRGTVVGDPREWCAEIESSGD